MSEAISWFERMFPSTRRRREAEEEIDKQFDKYCETVNGIRSDHGLDMLELDLARMRAAGRAVTKRIEDDERARESRP